MGQTTEVEWPFAARDLHCGICGHITFQGDWDRTPYCTHWDRSTTLDIGSVCEAFEPQPTGTDQPHQSPTSGGTDNSSSLRIDPSESKTGTRGPFYPVYRDDTLYSWGCSNCDSVKIMVDTMGRIECSGCGNTHCPSEWDAAYL